MKFKVTMKDPDTLWDAITDAVKKDVGSMNLNAEEKASIAIIRQDRAQEVANKWFEYGEYLTVEIDTDAGTIRVCDRVA